VSQTGAEGAGVPLPGGTTNAGRVVRVGGTVRRPAGEAPAAARALLDHLAGVGFDGAPRHLGVDEQGRDVLSFIDGEAPIAPYPPWALGDDALVGVARLLRRYHEAVEGFDPSGHVWPRAVPAAFRGRLVCHNDLNLDNVVFRDGRAVALIDFDLAGPASAVWDVAGAARHWVPLLDELDTPEALRGRWAERLRRFADAYGLARDDRVRLPVAARAAHRWGYDVVREAVGAGHRRFGRRWEHGGRERAERTARWLADNEGRMREVLS
jgi:hypothetical protein